jgi:hypothetical protein
LFVIVAQITIHALPYFDIENTTTMIILLLDRHENPYLKMQALMPTPRQREFGIVLVIFVSFHPT